MSALIAMVAEVVVSRPRSTNHLCNPEMSRAPAAPSIARNALGWERQPICARD